ncbi:MAG: rRNA maturation RNase YbeY [Pseudomonadota bacterium]
MNAAPVPHLDIRVDDDAWLGIDGVAELAERAAAAASAVAGQRLTDGAELGLILSSDAQIRILNRDHRNRDSATNVLSFPICDPQAPLKGPLLGDVVLALETVQTEAKTAKKPLSEHISHLIVHGILHLLGYDHQIDGEAEAMEDLERAAMKRLGYDDPYRDAAA